MPYRGGNWNNAGNAGLGALNLNNVRTNANTNIGFRPRFRSPMGQKLRMLRHRIQRLIERIPDPRHGETFSLTPENHKQSARGTSWEACRLRL